MERNFKDVLKHRRSYYTIGNGSPVPDKEIEDVLTTAVRL